MPELPDVEHFCNSVLAQATGECVDAVDVTATAIVEGDPAALNRQLKGKIITAVLRHGKHAFLLLQPSGALDLHFGLSGFPVFLHSADESETAHVRLRVRFSSGRRLLYDNRRLIGRVRFVPDVSADLKQERLGPDALAIHADAFSEAVSGKRGGIKAALMDQHTLAGIGNVYADDILFQAGIDPRTELTYLSDADLRDLHRLMQRVLKEAIEAKADPGRMPAPFLLPHRRAGAPCPRCGGGIRRITVASRTTYVCPNCQKRQH